MTWKQKWDCPGESSFHDEPQGWGKDEQRGDGVMLSTKYLFVFNFKNEYI